MENARTYYYARVSSTSQNLSRQLEAFRKDGADERNIITEKKSGATMDRPQYKLLKEQLLRSGDTLVIMSLDRLGRNKQDIKNELEYYKKHDIRVRILDIPTSNIKPPAGEEWITEMVNNIIIEVLSSQAEHERKMIRERQAQGIAIAKSEGKYHGRPPKPVDDEKLNILYQRYMNREISKTKIAEELGVSRPTLDRIFKRKGLAPEKNQ